MLVEDDPSLLEVVGYNLSREGYQVIKAVDGITALEIARQQTPDIILLDVMLPGMDGMAVCRILRKETDVPVIMLTARSQEDDKVAGLEFGADDYITKPFSMRELLSRVKAVLRRASSGAQNKEHQAEAQGKVIMLGSIAIDAARHLVSKGGKTVNLSPKEFDLLWLLMSNPGRVFSRDYLLERVWGYDWAGNTRTVDVHMRWLREKLEDRPDIPSHLLTVRGVGYKYEE